MGWGASVIRGNAYHHDLTHPSVSDIKLVDTQILGQLRLVHLYASGSLYGDYNY